MRALLNRIDWRVLLRPVCWVVGHDGRLIQYIGFVSENAAYPPSTVCERCGKSPAPITRRAWG